jgi:iron complex outermembrane recepter protein
VNGFTSEVRLSRVVSEGFIDRASSDLQSFYFTSAYSNPKSSLRVNVFSGKERTYQAWYGISEADLKGGNRTVNYAGTEKPGTPYDGETDNFTQTHYQFFFNHTLSEKLQLSTAVFLTKGKGYYEQYKADEDYARYGMPYPPSTGGPITSSDMVRQLWLDNDFYGNIFSLQYKKGKIQATLGGGYTRYDGNHFGKITWAEKGLTSINKWYDLDAKKTDFNIYLKQQTQLKNGLYLFYDLQYRRVNYTMDGFRDNPKLAVANTFNFFNPKAGISYRHQNRKYYLSYSVANKEPNRDDFEAGQLQQPRPETLHDIEVGAEESGKGYSWGATLYYMRYKDQLVLTGKINDVGAYTRTNIPRSFRAGIELQGAAGICKWVNINANLSFSRNRISGFTEYIDDYDNGGQKTNNYSNTAIAFSPAMVGSAVLNFMPVTHTELSLLNKYAGRQYLDNTEDRARSLSAFFVQDLRAIYTFKRKSQRPFALKEIAVTALVNNLWNTNYEPNGYTYSYIAGGSTVTENYYFPMAGRNFMLGVNMKF